ncbi:MAG: flagellar biosynthetic protein FliR [Planctomycetaceae bacterium]|jgi:flagellar biosynthetic protein FliR|nr:flagellar biosynthetic protein FliR [Phycisphaerales bacterium]MCE2653750.1 flagellar biosynthetic protein FliR [Planctomycetaceae bacterium]
MESLYAHVMPFLLVLFRLSGLFIFAPLLASMTIPTRVKILFAFSLTLCVYPTLPAGPAVSLPTDVFGLGFVVMTEVALGVIIGLLAMLPVVAVQLGAALMGQQMGFGLVTVYNPAMESDSDLLGELMLYVALGVFMALGGLEAMFVAVAESFAKVAPGGFAVGMAPLDLVAGVVSAGTELALRVSSPVLAIILLETVASGFLTRTMPQMNLMSIGFALKIGLGLLALVGGLTAMQHAVDQHIGEMGAKMVQYGQDPTSPPSAPGRGANAGGPGGGEVGGG